MPVKKLKHGHEDKPVPPFRAGSRGWGDGRAGKGPSLRRRPGVAPRAAKKGGGASDGGGNRPGPARRVAASHLPPRPSPSPSRVRASAGARGCGGRGGGARPISVAGPSAPANQRRGPERPGQSAPPAPPLAPAGGRAGAARAASQGSGLREVGSPRAGPEPPPSRGAPPCRPPPGAAHARDSRRRLRDAGPAGDPDARAGAAPTAPAEGGRAARPAPPGPAHLGRPAPEEAPPTAGHACPATPRPPRPARCQSPATSPAAARLALSRQKGTGFTGEPGPRKPCAWELAALIGQTSGPLGWRRTGRGRLLAGALSRPPQEGPCRLVPLRKKGPPRAEHPGPSPGALEPCPRTGDVPRSRRALAPKPPSNGSSEEKRRKPSKAARLQRWEPPGGVTGTASGAASRLESDGNLRAPRPLAGPLDPAEPKAPRAQAHAGLRKKGSVDACALAPASGERRPRAGGAKPAASGTSRRK
ncbi:protein FAM217B [Sorex fumeus]|uniref:protein FAM217B n=1 Tax=Sorex fumeus TaxID=62283 RepID=UPI0024AD83C2|nr:protein FAM217B [Sorex fumeus]